jgi:hypothetical protein
MMCTYISRTGLSAPGVLMFNYHKGWPECHFSGFEYSLVFPSEHSNTRSRKKTPSKTTLIIPIYSLEPILTVSAYFVEYLIAFER